MKAIRARGHDVRADHRTTMAIFGSEIEIRLREKEKMIKEIKDQRTNTRYESTGVLCFIVKKWSSEKTWIDRSSLIDRSNTIERQLSNIIAYLEIKGEELREQRIKREIEEKKRQEQERIKKELEKRLDIELNDFKLLLNLSIIRYISSRDNFVVESKFYTDLKRLYEII